MAQQPTPPQRLQIYRNLRSARAPISQLLADHLSSAHIIAQPHSFYPPGKLAHQSLSLTHSLFQVRNSHTVPGEQGLFCIRSTSTIKARYVGHYTGWLLHRILNQISHS